MKDHGESVSLEARHLGLSGDRWVEPFLVANMAQLRRLEVLAEMRAAGGLHLTLTPGSRVGAVPLLNPSTRKVAAGLLVEPRFRWSALGAVLNRTGFSVEPALGEAPPVPGSAREVPPWVIAGPVLNRIAGLLEHQRRGFIERKETRSSPRGRIDWTEWATSAVPRGRWTAFPCRFPDPDPDPDLMAAVRWTLARLREELTAFDHSQAARQLSLRAMELQSKVGPGFSRRPPPFWPAGQTSDWLTQALEAMGWVADERGLGGRNALDGLAWDLPIDAVWESWVCAFAADLGGRLGLTAAPFGSVRKPLRWEGPAHSMATLAPDVELRGSERVVWLDAKYKRHLDLLARRGWQGLNENLRHDHRADLHQALAYASLAEAPRVDTLLVYPQAVDRPLRAATIARVASGRRVVRLILASLPFGYRSSEQQESCLQSFRDLLAA